jgi:hypothetical protein
MKVHRLVDQPAPFRSDGAAPRALDDLSHLARPDSLVERGDQDVESPCRQAVVSQRSLKFQGISECRGQIPPAFRGSWRCRVYCEESTDSPAKLDGVAELEGEYGVMHEGWRERRIEGDGSPEGRVCPGKSVPNPEQAPIVKEVVSQLVPRLWTIGRNAHVAFSGLQHVTPIAWGRKSRAEHVRKLRPILHREPFTMAPGDLTPSSPLTRVGPLCRPIAAEARERKGRIEPQSELKLIPGSLEKAVPKQGLPVEVCPDRWERGTSESCQALV